MTDSEHLALLEQVKKLGAAYQWSPALSFCYTDNMYWVYVIRSLRKGSLYFGLTSGLQKRLLEHNAGKNVSTKFGIPWEFVYCEGYKSLKDARLREAKLKHYGNSRTHLKNRLKNSLL